VDLKTGYLDVHRAKRGHNAKHPLRGSQLRLLRELQRTYPDSPYVFVSERKAPLSPRAIRAIVARTGQVAGLPFVPHPHQLRHACGYYLASQGHDTRGPFRIIWGIRTFSIPCATPPWRPTDLNASGMIKLCPAEVDGGRRVRRLVSPLSIAHSGAEYRYLQVSARPPAVGSLHVAPAVQRHCPLPAAIFRQFFPAGMG
jgi:hypothetical protein